MRLKDDHQSFGWSFWLVAWCVVGVVIYVGGSDFRNFQCSIIWVMISMWVAIVAIYEKFFGQNAVGRRKARLALRRLCVECGYDLRATDNRCPECGHEMAASKARIDALEMLAGPATAHRLEVLDYESALDRLGQLNPSADDSQMPTAASEVEINTNPPNSNPNHESDRFGLADRREQMAHPTAASERITEMTNTKARLNPRGPLKPSCISVWA